MTSSASHLLGLAGGSVSGSVPVDHDLSNRGAAEIAARDFDANHARVQLIGMPEPALAGSLTLSSDATTPWGAVHHRGHRHGGAPRLHQLGGNPRLVEAGGRDRAFGDRAPGLGHAQTNSDGTFAPEATAAALCRLRCRDWR
jgi:hypothetical protein